MQADATISKKSTIRHRSLVRLCGDVTSPSNKRFVYLPLEADTFTNNKAINIYIDEVPLSYLYLYEYDQCLCKARKN